MLTLPKIVDRAAQPYVAIRERVTIPFNEAVDRAFGELFGWLQAHKIKASAAPFIKYNLIAMPELELEFGVPTGSPVSGDERVVAGTLPAGRYATVTYWGGYESLLDVNAVLIGWATQKGLKWDAEETPDGDRFASRLEIYKTDPQEEPDQSKWETEVTIKLVEA